MAVSVKLANMARFLAIVHIIVGFLLICFGIADRVIYFGYSWTGYMYYGIWIGVWVSIYIIIYRFVISEHEIMHALYYAIVKIKRRIIKIRQRLEFRVFSIHENILFYMAVDLVINFVEANVPTFSSLYQLGLKVPRWNQIFY